MVQERVTYRHRLRVFYSAIRSKVNKYTWSGLFIFVLGIAFIGVGITLSQGIYYSTPGLLIGLGAIVAIVGLIRILIGFINPQNPEDLPPLEEDLKEGESTVSVDDLYHE
ncbi:hypothetical protein [Ktedonospora formicarum]|uniref:Uncharacterized protein n=1 Tax=Ktedonospora formicarum TaxID=2778364 RepID=A0A8J3MTI3_9CHLR|nr:hypothetical protein [Ktedonospora formicarum]GHO44405.1 hypothetical protein KSX_25680 [Ktedonospora formicarum]